MSLIPAPRRSTCALWDPLLKTNKNSQRFLWGAASRIHVWEPFFWTLLYLRTALLTTEATLEHGDHGRKKDAGGGGRWVTLCLVPTRFCIPSPTIKSQRTSTKYYNSDVDFPEQEEWFLRHTRYSAKLIPFFFFKESVISRQYIFWVTIVYCSDDERATVLPPHCKWEIWKHLVHHNDTQEEGGSGTNRKTKWTLVPGWINYASRKKSSLILYIHFYTFITLMGVLVKILPGQLHRALNWMYPLSSA